MNARVALACLLISFAISHAVAEDRPNIVVVLVDDMGFSDLGCYGSEIETPNIDGLAETGLRFTQFYNSGRCCPTRASLMTGLQPHQAGIGHMTAPPNQPLGISGPYQGYLNDNCTTIASVLKSAGYHTLMTGKWHLGIEDQSEWPLQRGFDRYYGGLSGAFNYFKPGGDRGMTDGNDPATTDEDFYATDTFTDIACQYIGDAKAEDDKPFFLYLAFNAPHWPLNAKWNDFKKYKHKYKDGWDVVMKNRLAKQKEMGMFGAGTFYASHVGPEWESLDADRRDDLDSIMAAYAGCIDSIDQNIGKLIEYLESIGERKNTLILFLSDNGACQEGGMLGKGSARMIKNPPLETVDGVRLGQAWAGACNTPFRLYKHYVHEGGACTPMIAHWPAGIEKSRHGNFVRQAAYLPDIMATAIELSGATYPADKPAIIGKSLSGIITGDAKSAESAVLHDEPLFWEHEGNAAVRWGKWKLVREYEKPWELYNIEADRTELNDLSEVNTNRREKMIALWEAWAKKTGVAFPERFNMYEYLKKRK